MFPGNSAISGAESVCMVYSLFMVSPELKKTNTQGENGDDYLQRLVLRLHP